MSETPSNTRGGTATPDASPFDDIRALAASVPTRDDAAYASLLEKADHLGQDLAPLGRLAAPLARVVSVQAQAEPRLARPLVAVFTGSQGVAADSVHGAKRRVVGLSEGTCAVRGVAQAAGAAFKVYEFGTEYPSADFRNGPSLSERDCAAAMAFGMEVVAEGADVVVMGNAGFGSATAAAAIALALYGGSAEYWASGLGEKAAARVEAVRSGHRANSELGNNPLDILSAYGGRDLAGTVGAILACAHQRIPVILDGYVVSAAAAVAHAINPDAVAHCIAGHVSAEPAHAALLDRMDLAPVLDLGLNIGDGTGGTLALTLLQGAAAGLGTLSS